MIGTIARNLVCLGALLLVIDASAAPAAGCDTRNLFERVGGRYGIDPVLLYAIALTESGARPDATARNTNGSIDHGAMQINSVHLPVLAQFGIRRDDLYNPCVNVDVGGWVLAHCFARWGVTWDGVGCYNSSAPARRASYARKVAVRYHALLRGRSSPPPVAQRSQAPSKPAADRAALLCASETGCLVERTSAGQLLVSAADPRVASLMVR